MAPIEIVTRHLQVDRDRGHLRAEVHLPLGLRFFNGHFAGKPILPGVVQVSEIVLPLLEAHWPRAGTLTAIQRLKFKELIVPGDTLSLSIQLEAAGVLRFRLERAEVVCCSGTLQLTALPE